MKILVMMTGGTISTTENESGHLSANGKNTVSLLAKELYRHGFSEVEFDYVHPLDILSENMTIPRLGRILDAFSETMLENYDSVIVAHGTDTLAYTSSLLALVLAGAWDKPVFIVSSDYTLTDPRANGHANFRAAVELTLNGFGAGVYVPYRNSDGVTYLHHGAHLVNCANYTSDFFSADMLPYTEAKPYKISVEYPILAMLRRLQDSVLKIEPYVGIDYSVYRLPENIKAVLHGSYHSSTACAERAKKGEPYTKRSLLYFADECKKSGVDIFLSPLPESMREKSGRYSTTADLISHGIQPIYSLTNETAYMKLVLAYSLGYERDEIIPFMMREIADEQISW